MGCSEIQGAIVTYEVAIRLGFFFGVFALIAIWEVLAPRRSLTTAKTVRWLSNLGITFLNPVAVRLVSPIMPVTMALLAQKSGWGLLNNFALPYWLPVVIGVAVLDLVPRFINSITYLLTRD
jgi:hypothetical protein